MKKFRAQPCSVEAFPAEEVGVEHLLREVKNLSLDAMEQDVNQKILSLKGLVNKIKMVLDYLGMVERNELRINNEIIYNLQEILNLMPRITHEESVRAFHTKTNDNFFTIYVSSIVKAIISLHNLVNNKLQLRLKDQKSLKDGPKDKAGEKKEAAEEEKK